MQFLKGVDCNPALRDREKIRNEGEQCKGTCAAKSHEGKDLGLVDLDIESKERLKGVDGCKLRSWSRDD